jgi:hypothetical protein
MPVATDKLQIAAKSRAKFNTKADHSLYLLAQLALLDGAIHYLMGDYSI